MKVLIYSMNFHPEQTGIGKYSGEMAFWLSDKGHDVRVICAPPYYPSWRIAEGFSSWKYQLTTEQNVRIFRTPVWIPKRPGGISRVFHLLSFALSSFPVVMISALWKPDVVFTVAPSLASAPAGALVAKLSRSKSWLHVQDFEVDVSFKMGLLKGRLTQFAALWLESRLFQAFDTVSTISDRMRTHLIRKGVDGSRAKMLPNWVDISKIAPVTGVSPYRRELEIPENAKVALFSGSLGEKQGLLCIPLAANLLKGHPNIYFVICGDGVMKKALETASAGLPNVKLLPLQPLAKLNDLLNLADFHLLPQSPEAEDLVLPSKLSGMLASGRPILATCREDTDIAKIVSKCGRVCAPENPHALAEAILSLAGQRQEEIARLGSTARRLAEDLFSKDKILQSFVNELRPMMPARSSGATRDVL